MNHYDVTIRETLEVKIKVAANSREEAEQFAMGPMETRRSRSGRQPFYRRGVPLPSGISRDRGER